jgi:hypothetical protein
MLDTATLKEMVQEFVGEKRKYGVSPLAGTTAAQVSPRK